MEPMSVSLAEAYVAATNAHDAEGFLDLFAHDAVVDDVGREIRGRGAIRVWSLREIFQANVTLKIHSASGQGDAATLVVEVDGDFDRTGLPNPLVMNHALKLSADKIVRLTCRLGSNAGEES